MRAEAKPRDGWVSGNPQDHFDGTDAPMARLALNSIPLAALVPGWDLPCQGTFHDLEGNAGICPESQPSPKVRLRGHEMAARQGARTPWRTESSTHKKYEYKPAPQPLVVRRLKRPGETGEAARQYGRARIWLWNGVLRFETSSTRIAASP